MSSIPFSDWENPTFIWIAILSIRFISVLLSAYSTFTPLFDDFKMRNYIKFKRRATFRSQLLKMIQILLHIFFATAMVYLVSVVTKIFFRTTFSGKCPFFENRRIYGIKREIFYNKIAYVNVQQIDKTLFCLYISKFW